jgi:hypothetical protein
MASKETDDGHDTADKNRGAKAQSAGSEIKRSKEPAAEDS